MKVTPKKRVPEKHEGIESYHEISKYYDAHQVLKKKWGWDIYNLISRNILKNIKMKEHGKVLDVACGYGGLINRLSKYRERIEFTGIDISKPMVDFGEKHFANKRIKFLVMSGDNLKFPDESFDYILCKDAFHHFNNPIKAMKEMFRILKKGGYLYAIDLRRDTSANIFYEMIQLSAELNIENATAQTESHLASFTKKEMANIVKKAGIKKYKIFTPKIGKNFLGYYNLKGKSSLTASIYLKDKMVIVIKK